MKFQARAYLLRHQSVLIDKIILTPRRGTLKIYQPAAFAFHELTSVLFS